MAATNASGAFASAQLVRPWGYTARVAASSALASIFTPDVLSRLTLVERPTPRLTARLRVLTAPDCSWRPVLLAQRRAWARYIEAAREAGVLDQQLRGRLAGADDDGFRSALSECLACWFLGRRLHLAVEAGPPGRRGAVLDFWARHSTAAFGVEVKAPYAEPIYDQLIHGDESGDLAECLRRANKQFPDTHPNLLVIVPSLRSPVPYLVRDLVRAVLAQEVMRIPIDLVRGGAAGPMRGEFILNGAFTRPMKPDRSPGHTRVSAVLMVQEQVAQRRGGRAYVRHDAVVIHNPHARIPISPLMWRGLRQMVRTGNVMRWTTRPRRLAAQERAPVDRRG